MAKMETATPSAKVIAAAAAALIAPIVLGVLAKAFPDMPLPVDANDLAQQVIQGIIIGALTFLAGYFRTPASRDQVVQEGTPPPTQTPE